ncbi:hypothetical protein P9112_008062 [Eukaryota sp. TZLM1-RC]
MYKFHIRGYAVLSTAITCFAVLAAFNALSMFWLNNKAVLSTFTATPHIHSQHHYGSIQHILLFNFNISLDLTPEFNWNTKQVYVYVQAEYEFPSGNPHKSIVWNRIVTRQDADVTSRYDDVSRWNLDIEESSEFPIWIPKQSLSSPIKLTLFWEISPYSGLLYRRRADSSLEVSLSEMSF